MENSENLYFHLSLLHINYFMYYPAEIRVSVIQHHYYVYCVPLHKSFYVVQINYVSLIKIVKFC
jgi:hypothetical protein